jgi:hypothetical protein
VITHEPAAAQPSDALGIWGFGGGVVKGSC